MSTRPLTVSDTVALAAICSAAQRSTRIARLLDTGDIFTGTARSIGDENGGFAGPQDDIRDMYLRVTSTFEHFLPIAELIDEVKAGTFVTDYEG
jgi:hypothetical protein